MTDIQDRRAWRSSAPDDNWAAEEGSSRIPEWRWTDPDRVPLSERAAPRADDWTPEEKAEAAAMTRQMDEARAQSAIGMAVWQPESGDFRPSNAEEDQQAAELQEQLAGGPTEQGASR